jgi:opacity protein-like surface antigen
MRIAGAVCLALGLASTPALANDGFYIEFQGGGSFLQDSDIQVRNAGLSRTGRVDYDTGWNVGTAVGYRMRDMLRVEAHASWRMADLNAVRLEGADLDLDGAFLGAAMFLGNAYFDIPVGKIPVKPYVGAGAGVGIFSADTSGTKFFGRRFFDSGGDDAQFAWNVMGGFFVPLFTHLELDARYRYITANDPKMDVDMFGLNLDGSIQSEFEAHEVVGALRVVF